MNNDFVDLIVEGQKTDYQINKLGQVYSYKTNKILKGNINNTGYRLVCLTINGKKKQYSVHRLVAETFLPNPDNLPVVNHKDGDKLNDCVNNLEWVSQSKNVLHSYQNNLTSRATGKRNKVEGIEEGQFWKRYRNSNYLVSKDGQVYNTKTSILLKPSLTSAGYKRCTLRIDGQNKSTFVHRMVVECWIDPNLKQSDIINHIDGNTQNNNYTNLEVCDKSENSMYACYVLYKGVKAVAQYDMSGKLLNIFPSRREAARQLDIDDSGISQAISGAIRTYKGYIWKDVQVNNL